MTNEEKTPLDETIERLKEIRAELDDLEWEAKEHELSVESEEKHTALESELLDELLPALAIGVVLSRAAYDRASAVKNELMSRPEIKKVFDDITETTSAKSIAEKTLREAAELAAELTGSDEPVPGVKIAEVSTLTYNSDVAFKWCEDNMPTLIVHKLDDRAFGKVMKALPPSNLPRFVTVGKEPSARISSKLADKLKASVHFPDPPPRKMEADGAGTS